MNLEAIIIRVNKSLQNFSKKTTKTHAHIHAINLFKTVCLSSDSHLYFGDFLNTCPYRYLRKMRFFCDVEQTVSGRFYVNRVSLSVKWTDDWDSLHRKVANLNDLFAKLDYTNLSSSSNVEDAFNLDHLKSYKF